MEIDRRKFLAMTTAAMAVSCDLALAADSTVVDAGPAASYAKDGVYDAWRDLGFFIVRHEGKLSALSSICTHRKTKLMSRPDCTFLCKRHGSTFDPSGHVTKGPATKDIPALATTVDAAGHLLVTVTAT